MHQTIWTGYESNSALDFGRHLWLWSVKKWVQCPLRIPPRQSKRLSRSKQLWEQWFLGSSLLWSLRWTKPNPVGQGLSIVNQMTYHYTNTHQGYCINIKDIWCRIWWRLYNLRTHIYIYLYISTGTHFRTSLRHHHVAQWSYIFVAYPTEDCQVGITGYLERKWSPKPQNIPLQFHYG